MKMTYYVIENEKNVDVIQTNFCKKLLTKRKIKCSIYTNKNLEADKHDNNTTHKKYWNNR